MGKRAVDEDSLTALANAIREQTNDPAKLVFPEDFMGAIHVIHAGGYSKGCTDAVAECASRHFIQTFVGDGSGLYSFRLPFEPDYVHISCLDPKLIKKQGLLADFYYDCRAFGFIGGFIQYGSSANTSGLGNMAMTTTSARSRYSRTQDGTVTIQNIGGSSADITYAVGMVYTIVAVKCIEQTDKERITAFVEELTGSGSVQLNEAKVKAAFTDEAWAQLIDGVNWTFIWI